MRYILSDGNAIEATPEFMAEAFPDGGYTAAPDPSPPTPPLTWGNAPPEYWHVDVGPYLDRFGAAQLAILASVDPVVSALVISTTARKFIDLKRPDVLAGCMMLQSKGFDIDPVAITTTPTTNAERHVKGLPQPAPEV